MGSLTGSDKQFTGWLVWLWVLFILFCSSALAGTLADTVFAFFLPSGGLQGGLLQLLAQKCFHIFLFVVLGLLAALPHRLRTPLLCVGLCFAIGIGSEGFQALWPTRSPSALDAVLNVLSALAAYALVFRWLSRRILAPT